MTELEAKLLGHLKGAALTDLVVCLGDEAHAPHIDLFFGEFHLTIMHHDKGLMAGLTAAAPAATTLAGKDYHPPSGVLQ